ncbi:MAG: dihydrolipoyl dehydrogenase [Chloroflexi bacterium]|nr:MAG: dihydrolipoyl dehydrogenase [Chloroflexota bacterium]RLC87963.1 MAG: dihydrolipoyl dehydrogenase [Chloroflexota bacterium]
MEQTYDVTIIGAGPGGYVAAIRAAQLGLKVALVEKERLGGVCLNWGCIPTKSLLRNAEVISLLGRGKEFGFTVAGFEADFSAAVDRSRKVSGRLVKGVGALMRKNEVEVIEGSAVLKSPGVVEVTLNAGGARAVETRNIVVATGGRARTIPGIEMDGERVLIYREAIVLRDLPASAVIVGAGPIGMEFAHIWATYGAEVTVVEMLPRVLPLEDEEASKEVARAFKRRKVRLLTSTRVQGIETTGDGVRVSVTNAEGEQVLEAERALIAIGVQPHSQGLGLEEIGVQMERGNIVVNDEMRTNVACTSGSVYAIGDVTGKLPLAHVASAQGIVAAETIAGVETVKLDYEAMPRCTYCHPQVASFGLTEGQAVERGYEVRVGKFPFRANGKALGLGDYDGFVKIVAEESSGEILGGHLVGPEVTELLPELVLAHQWELTPEEIARTVHAHPTLSEALMEAAHGVFGKAIHV